MPTSIPETPSAPPAVDDYPVSPVVPVTGTGETFLVASSGSDENDGSAEAPWATIQHAVDSVSPGDTILIQSGSYTGARIERSGVPDGWITLASAPGATVRIDAPGPANKRGSNLEFETWEGDGTVAYWLVEGLEVAEAPQWGIDIRGSDETHSHHFVVRGNRVHSNGWEDVKSGIFMAFVDDVLVEDNESYDNGEHGVYLSNSGDRFVVRGNYLHGNARCGLHINGDLEQGGDGIISDGVVEGNVITDNGEEGCAGINLDGVTDAIVRNNLIYGNHAGGIAIFQENGAVCSQDIQVLNNTIVQAEDGRWAIYVSDADCINNTIFNNIIVTYHEWRGSIVIAATGIEGFESDHNVVMDRFSADDDESVISLSDWQALGYDSNSIVASPEDLFVGGDDYHLDQGSPAVDAGRAIAGLATDIEGNQRPQGQTYDIGAFETAGSPPARAQDPPTSTPQAGSDAGGTITYTAGDRLFRIVIGQESSPQDLTSALDQVFPGGFDSHVNISPDGAWLALETERFEPECDGWSCLAVVSSDLSSGGAVRADGEVVHPQGFSAVASGGDLVAYPSNDGPHEIDLWAVSRSGDAWSAPLLLSGESPHEFNYQPAISDDGSKLVFNCGPRPYSGEGTALCEVGVDGTGFDVLLTPADAPTGFPTIGALHHPDYAPDGSIVFEADWDSEQIWHLPLGAAEPVRVTGEFGNDNSPCVLPDGTIASLWLDRPTGSGVHELKVMAPDGSEFAVLLPDVDVLDVGIGCSR